MLRAEHLRGSSRALAIPKCSIASAHCQGPPFEAVVGRQDLARDDGEVFFVSTRQQRAHPEYDHRTNDNDVMLAFLDAPASGAVGLARLNADGAVPAVDAAMTVIGWGDTDASDSEIRVSDKLLRAEVRVVSNEECGESADGRGETYAGRITANMLCARDREQRRDSCQGDSGGPLVASGGAGNLQVGVVSWGIGCATEFPGGET